MGDYFASMSLELPRHITIMGGLYAVQTFGNSGLRVSEAALGTMTFGEDWGWGSAKDEALKVYNAFREAGGNFIDTANLYTNGTSELFLGEFMKSHRQGVAMSPRSRSCSRAPCSGWDDSSLENPCRFLMRPMYISSSRRGARTSKMPVHFKRGMLSVLRQPVRA